MNIIRARELIWSILPWKTMFPRFLPYPLPRPNTISIGSGMLLVSLLMDMTEFPEPFSSKPLSIVFIMCDDESICASYGTIIMGELIVLALFLCFWGIQTKYLVVVVLFIYRAACEKNPREWPRNQLLPRFNTELCSLPLFSVNELEGFWTHALTLQYRSTHTFLENIDLFTLKKLPLCVQYCLTITSIQDWIWCHVYYAHIGK